jgi:hypothetical protein
MSVRLCCRVCGSTTGPFLPDPAGDPDGGRFICSRRCQGEAPPVDTTVPAAVLDLLSVIRDLADVPLPSLDDADERAWRTLMLRRLGDLHTVLDVALSPKWVGDFDPAREAAILRERLSVNPVTYATYGREGDR